MKTNDDDDRYVQMFVSGETGLRAFTVGIDMGKTRVSIGVPIKSPI